MQSGRTIFILEVDTMHAFSNGVARLQTLREVRYVESVAGGHDSDELDGNAVFMPGTVVHAPSLLQVPRVSLPSSFKHPPTPISRSAAM
jgi:hypothetical protein